MNKQNEDIETRQNGIVEDLEKIVNEIFDIQMKIEVSTKGSEGKIAKLSKAVDDLEAHINSSVITVSSLFELIMFSFRVGKINKENTR